MRCKKCSSEVIPSMSYLGFQKYTKDGWYAVYDQECNNCNTPVIGVYFTNDKTKPYRYEDIVKNMDLISVYEKF